MRSGPLPLPSISVIRHRVQGRLAERVVGEIWERLSRKLGLRRLGVRATGGAEGAVLVLLLR